MELAVIGLSAWLLLGWLCSKKDKEKGPSANDLSKEIRQTGWESRRAMDQASDEYLKKVRQQSRR